MGRPRDQGSYPFLSRRGVSSLRLPLPLPFPTMRFLALGIWAENPAAGSRGKPPGNRTPGVGCAARRGGRGGACGPRRPAAPDAGSGLPTSSRGAQARTQAGPLDLSHRFWEERERVWTRSWWACPRKELPSRYLNKRRFKSCS